MNPLPGNTIESADLDGAFCLPPTGAIFDVAMLQQAHEQVLSRVALRTSDRGGDQIRCVCLTHRPDAEDPATDGLASQFAEDGSLRYLERDFSCFDERFADTYFATVHRAVSAMWAVGRMRLMTVYPGQVFRMHADATQRAHLAVHTVPETYLVGPTGHGHHVPADGCLRVFDTRMPHTVFNAGNQPRVHLLLSVADTERAHHRALLCSGSRP